MIENNLAEHLEWLQAHKLEAFTHRFGYSSTNFNVAGQWPSSRVNPNTIAQNASSSSTTTFPSSATSLSHSPSSATVSSSSPGLIDLTDDDHVEEEDVFVDEPLLRRQNTFP